MTSQSDDPERGRHAAGPSAPLDHQRCGWTGDFNHFGLERSTRIRQMLVSFVPDASSAQIDAWDDGIQALQPEIRKAMEREPKARAYSAVLEYRLPREARRPDVVLLVTGSVVVLELKGRHQALQSHIDQALAYARDLANYHRDCEGREVHAVVVPTAAKGRQERRGEVHVTGPDGLADLIAELDRPELDPPEKPIAVERFLSPDAYRPLPTLVKAARQLMVERTPPRIRQVNEQTDAAFEAVMDACRAAAATRTRKLVLLSGVPGSGKTFVGLRVAHAAELDQLSVERREGKPTAPAVYLSGNRPLVQVLRHELQLEGSQTAPFVRDLNRFMDDYNRTDAPVPPEHVLVFDEAQRAWDADKIRKGLSKSGKRRGKIPARVASQPELFAEFAERVPEWCVVVALLGEGQEIFVGEEGGVPLWASALRGSSRPDQWSVVAAPEWQSDFDGVEFKSDPRLRLTNEVRTHGAMELHRVVSMLVDGPAPVGEVAGYVKQLETSRFALRLTRSLAVAKQYVRSRYSDEPDRRFGMLMSSRVAKPERLGIQTNARVEFLVERWFADDENTCFSCRNLAVVPSEFEVQGLELDCALLAWGDDFRIVIDANGDLRWSDELRRKYKAGGQPKDAMRLRRNAYRVLMTRGRDGLVIWVPPDPKLDATYEYFAATGMKILP